MKVAAIIPAYNEEKGIADVLKAVTGASLPNEVIVVSDGSTDKTVEVAKTFPVNVIEQVPNQGKAAAMLKGVENTDAEILVFVDADLVGLTPELVDSLIRPIIEDQAEVTMGLFQDGKFSTDLAQMIFPFLTGQRAMKRSVWEGARVKKNSQYGVEVYLTKYMAKQNLRAENILLKGCTQLFKEQKGQAFEGFGRRLKMTFDIVKALFASTEEPGKTRKHKKHITGKLKPARVSRIKKHSTRTFGGAK